MEKRANTTINKTFRCIASALLFCMVLSGSVSTAKSLYVAGDTEKERDAALWVYDVQPDGKIVLQTTSIFPKGGASGVNGLGVDPNTNTLFVTYTQNHYSGIMDSDTLEWKKFIYLVPVDTYPGGMVYDEANGRIYTTDEGKSRLIIYKWVPEMQSWHNIGYGASEVLLTNPNAGAIAYDPDQELVYVATKGGGAEILKIAEQRSDWQQMGSIQLAFEAKALSVDSRKQYLYAGGLSDKGTMITQYNLATGNRTQLLADDYSEAILSLCVDNATSMIYVLVYDTLTFARSIHVYTSSLQLVQTISVPGEALELFVPSSSVGYNPLDLTMTPVSGVSQSNGAYVASPGVEISYQVCMTNSNLFPVTDIALTDTLPSELEFVRAEGLGNALGVFDTQSHTYYYHNPYLDPNSTECFNLVARVSDQAVSGTVMTNSIAVDSNETAQSGVSVDVEVGYNTLGLTKTIVMDPNYTKVGDTIYVQAGDYVTYQVCLSNLNNYNAVTNVLLVDQLSDYVEFVSAEQAGLISHYDASTHSYSWAFNIIEPNYLDCLDITVRIRDNVPPGLVISNEVMLGGSETFTVTAQANLTVKYDALAVNISVMDSPDYNPVTNQVVKGGILTYVIDVNNVDPSNAADNVVIMDSVPEGLLFIGSSISGDANGIYDSLSRTFILEQPTIAPGQGIHVELTFVVADTVPGNTVLTNSLVAMANGAPASSQSLSVSVYEPAVGSVATTLDLYYTGPLQRDTKLDDIMVVMKFPEYIDLADIDTTQALVMTPGPSTAYHKDSVQSQRVYFVYGLDGKVRVKGFFDRQPVLNALVAGQETVTISVTGSLKDGRSFVGQATASVN